MLDTTVFLDLLTWFIKESGHPDYSGITPPDECPQSHVIVDPDNEHNTNKEAAMPIMRSAFLKAILTTFLVPMIRKMAPVSSAAPKCSLRRS